MKKIYNKDNKLTHVIIHIIIITHNSMFIIAERPRGYCLCDFIEYKKSKKKVLHSVKAFPNIVPCQVMLTDSAPVWVLSLFEDMQRSPK